MKYTALDQNKVYHFDITSRTVVAGPFDTVREAMRASVLDSRLPLSMFGGAINALLNPVKTAAQHRQTYTRAMDHLRLLIKDNADERLILHAVKAVSRAHDALDGTEL